jgi:hypothetical protein
MALQPNSGMLETQKLLGASNYIVWQFRIKNILQEDYLWNWLRLMQLFLLDQCKR